MGVMTPQKTSYRLGLERNIRMYAWFKIFTKKVYLPLIAIHLVTVGGVTVAQLGLMATVGVVTQFLLQLPTGYMADRYGNRFAIVTGSALISVSALFYACMPNFVGGMAAIVLYMAGVACNGGAIESMMHDSLSALGRAKDYTRVLGRAQSYGLVGSTILILLIPATYTVNQMLPFLLGFLCNLMLVVFAFRFTYPPRADGYEVKNPLAAIRAVVNKQNLLLFVFAGFTSGVLYRGGEYRELLLQDLGMAVAWLGVVVAVGNVVGVIMGLFLHKLEYLSDRSFYLVDLVFLSGCLFGMGITSNLWAVATASVFLVGYFRVRSIIFQAKFFRDTGHHYKATLISALNTFSLAGEVLVVLILSWTVTHLGYSAGYLATALAALVVGVGLWAAVQPYLARQVAARQTS